MLIATPRPAPAHVCVCSGLLAELPEHVQLPAADRQHRRGVEHRHLPPLDRREPVHAERQRPGRRPELGEQERLRGDAQRVDADVITSTSPRGANGLGGRGRGRLARSGQRPDWTEMDVDSRDEVRHPIVAAVARGFQFASLARSPGFLLTSLRLSMVLRVLDLISSTTAMTQDSGDNGGTILTGFGVRGVGGPSFSLCDIGGCPMVCVCFVCFGHAVFGFVSCYRTSYRMRVPAGDSLSVNLPCLMSAGGRGVRLVTKGRSVQYFISAKYRKERTKTTGELGSSVL